MKARQSLRLAMLRRGMRGLDLFRRRESEFERRDLRGERSRKHIDSLRRRRAWSEWLAYCRDTSAEYDKMSSIQVLSLIHRKAKLRMGWEALGRVMDARRSSLGLIERAGACFRLTRRRRAFNTFRAYYDSACRVRQQLGTAIGEWRGSFLRRAWFTWMLAFSARLRLRHAVSALANRASRRALNSWCDFADRAVDAKRQMRRALSSLVPELKALRRGFEAMLAAQGIRQAQRKMSAGLVDSRRLRAFSSWVDAADALSRRKRLLRGGVSALVHRSQRRALSTWFDFASARSSALRLLRRSARALVDFASRKAFNTWSGHSQSVAHAMTRLHRAFHPEGRLLGRAFNTLCQMYEERRSRVRVLAAVRDRRRFAAFNTWAANAGKSRRRQDLMRRGLSVLRSSGRARALWTWKDFVEERQHAIGLMHRSRAALRNGGILRAMSAWREASQTFAVGLTRARVAIREWRGGHMRKAFLMWQARQRSRQALRRALQAIRNRGLRRGLNGWLEGAGKAHAWERRVRRALTAFVPELRALRKAFEAIVETAEAYQLRARALAGFRDAHRLRALNAWKAMRSLRNERFSLAQRAAAAMRQTGRLRGFLAWDEFTRERMEARRLASRSVNALLHGARFRALNTWRELQRDRRRALTMLRRSSDAMRDGKARRGFNSWKAHALWRLPSREILRKGGLACLKLEVRVALNTWMAVLEREENRVLRQLRKFGPEGRMVRKAFATLAALPAFKQKKLKAAAGFTRNAELRAFRTWRIARSAMARNKMLLHYSAKSMTQRNKRIGLNTWMAYSEAAKETLRLLRSGAIAMRNRGLRMAYSSWASVVQTQSRDAMLLRRGVSALVTRGMRRGYVCWREKAEEASRQLALLKRSGAAMVARGRYRALGKWKEFAAEGAEAMAMLRRGASAMIHGNMRRAYVQWRHGAIDAQRALAKLAKAFHPVLRRKSKAFRSLLAHAESMHERRAMSAGFRDRHRLKAFNTWLEAIEAGAQRTTLMRRGVAALVSRGKRRAYLAWRENAEDQIWRLSLLRRGMAAIALRGLRMAFVAWLGDAESNARAATRLGSALHEWRGSNIRRAWFTWHGQFSARQRMAGCVRSIRQRGKRMGFNTWHGAVETREKWKKRVKRALSLALDTTARRRLPYLREWGYMASERKALLRAHDVYRVAARRRSVKAGYLVWRFAALRIAQMKREEAQRAAERAERLAQIAAEEKAAAEAKAAEERAAAEAKAEAEAKALAELEAAQKAAEEAKAMAEKAAAEAKAAAEKAAAEAAIETIPRAPSPPLVQHQPMPFYPLARKPPKPKPKPAPPSILHVVHHHRGLPSSASAPKLGPRSATPGQSPARRRSIAAVEPSRPGTWSTASSRAKARVGPMVPLDLGAAYFHQLEESQMLAAVRWRGEYEGLPHNLARALESADAFNQVFDPPVEWGDRIRSAAVSSTPPARYDISAPPPSSTDASRMAHRDHDDDDANDVDDDGATYHANGRGYNFVEEGSSGEDLDERYAGSGSTIPASAFAARRSGAPPQSSRRAVREPPQVYNRYEGSPYVDPLDERARPYYHNGETRTSPEEWRHEGHEGRRTRSPPSSAQRHERGVGVGSGARHVQHHQGRFRGRNEAAAVSDDYFYWEAPEATGASGGGGAGGSSPEKTRYYKPPQHQPRSRPQYESPPPPTPLRTPPLTKGSEHAFGPSSAVAGPTPMPMHAWSARRSDVGE